MIRIIGAGLAGSEAAYYLGSRGVEVELVDMKPQKFTPAHESANFGELVCSNSLKSDDIWGNACGLLKEEMRRLGSLTMAAAEVSRVPAGGALAVDREKFSWERLGAMDLVEAGHRIGKPELLFEKIEDDVIQRQLDKLAATKAANMAAEAAQNVEAQKDTIQFDDFQKMDIRVSTILSAEKVAKTKKLLKLTVDTGIDRRVIVSGIAEHFTPEELVGRQVLVLVNLAPRDLKGITSSGMILMAEDASGKLRLLQPSEATNNGAIVG